MILSDREIKAALGRGVIGLSPMPDGDAWTSTAVDLRLAKDISKWNIPDQGADIIFRPAKKGYDAVGLMRQHTKSEDISAAGMDFHAGEFCLGWTMEKIRLPYRSRLAARVEGKSSLARLGIGVHVTAPTIHAGFGDKPNDDKYAGLPIQLEIFNIGKLSVKLEAGMRICQLIIEWVDGTPEKGYDGRFNAQAPIINK